MARTETVTVVFTDLVGSTELASRLGHGAYEALRNAHFTALRGAVTKHNGSEVKTTSDGLMLRFDSAASAIACAIAMQQATNGAGRGAGRDPVQIRIGISSGEATREDDDVYGPPVVEAARLCAVAAGEQIVISDVVRSLARGRGHTFASLGELTLKGLPEPVASFAVQWEPLAAGVPLPPRVTKAPLAMFGRDAESQALAAAWAKAKDGQRQLALVAGEPGIGKTRLATEAALAARAEGAIVLLGTCDEDVNLPYQPFVEAMRHYVAHAPEDVLAAHVREHKGELVRLAPELAKRVSDLPAPQVAESETERYLLFEALSSSSSGAPAQCRSSRTRTIGWCFDASEGIKEAIGRRLNRLSDETNRILYLAAVIGRQFDLPLLTRMADTREEAILDALDEAGAAALVAELPGTVDRFAFSQALIRTTLYEELSASRRARLHRRVGEALEELTGTNPEARIDELAHHWLAATQVSDQAKAIGYARQAGERALANLAFEEHPPRLGIDAPRPPHRRRRHPRPRPHRRRPRRGRAARHGARARALRAAGSKGR